jgi:hypothetical protein
MFVFRYLRNVAVGLAQVIRAAWTRNPYALLWYLDTFGNALAGGDPQETISSRLGKLQRAGKLRFYQKPIVWFLHAIDRYHALDAIQPEEGSDAILAAPGFAETWRLIEKDDDGTLRLYPRGIEIPAGWWWLREADENGKLRREYWNVPRWRFAWRRRRKKGRA